MIFYGTKGAHLKSEKVSGIKCPNCGEHTSHTVSIFGRYFYIYWIPIFPLTKKGVSECDNCKATFEPKEMSEQLRLKYNNVKSDTKTPLTYWIGSFIILSIIAFTFYSVAQHDKNVVEYISNPKKGDIVEYKPTEYYSTQKVIKVTTDSVFLSLNNYEIESKGYINKIDKVENYSNEFYGVTKEQYQKMFDEKLFIDVNR